MTDRGPTALNGLRSGCDADRLGTGGTKPLSPEPGSLIGRRAERADLDKLLSDAARGVAPCWFCTARRV